MTSIGKTVVAALAMGALIGALSACEKKEGPVERAGKEIDKAVDKVGQQVEKAGEKIQDAASGAKK
jgi:predicted acylesterase/phospholipase RssA